MCAVNFVFHSINFWGPTRDSLKEKTGDKTREEMKEIAKIQLRGKVI